jgi:two-component system, OmpR family, alkaline phosphatase synthesis response regulator PhoP
MEREQYSILLVDDEPDVLEFLSYNLIKEGYQVLKANNGKDAIALLKDNRPHLVILDVMMPGIDGIETCRLIREMPGFEDTIVIFLTARGEEYSQLAGFDAGADDYITKPIRPGILTSRVKALLRRSKAPTLEDAPSDKQEIFIDKEKYLVVNNGREISLPRKEFELLSLLVSKPNRVFTREEIYSNVWGTGVIVGDRTIDVHVRRIREKIGIDNIITIKGVGYKYSL